MIDLCVTPGLILHTAYSSNNKNKTQTQTKPAEFRAIHHSSHLYSSKGVTCAFIFLKKKMFFPMQKTLQSMYYLCYGGSGDTPFVLGKRAIRTFVSLQLFAIVLGSLTLESVTVCQQDSDLKEVWTSLLGLVDERLCCQPAV